jgi:hypothetical protein
MESSIRQVDDLFEMRIAIIFDIIIIIIIIAKYESDKCKVVCDE